MLTFIIIYLLKRLKLGSIEIFLFTILVGTNTLIPSISFSSYLDKSTPSKSPFIFINSPRIFSIGPHQLPVCNSYVIYIPKYFLFSIYSTTFGFIFIILHLPFCISEQCSYIIFIELKLRLYLLSKPLHFYYNLQTYHINTISN